MSDLEDIGDLIRSVRANRQCSIQEARRVAYEKRILDAVHDAQTLDDLKKAVRAIVEHLLP